MECEGKKEGKKEENTYQKVKMKTYINKDI
jgi:hypothetical protein